MPGTGRNVIGRLGSQLQAVSTMHLNLHISLQVVFTRHRYSTF